MGEKCHEHLGAQVDENLSVLFMRNLRLAVPLGERHFWIEMLKKFQSVVK